VNPEIYERYLGHTGDGIDDTKARLSDKTVGVVRNRDQACARIGPLRGKLAHDREGRAAPRHNGSEVGTVRENRSRTVRCPAYDDAHVVLARLDL